MAPGPKGLLERRVSKVLAKPPSVRYAAQAIALVTASLMVVTGVLEWAFDHKTFPNVWLGMWWAAQTVTTVGYGDIVPISVGGRLVGIGTMLFGVAIVSVITAIITSTFIQRAALEREEATGSPSATDAKIDEAVADIVERLERLETLLRAGHAGSAD
jgi:voltage-gated potassium channel